MHHACMHGRTAWCCPVASLTNHNDEKVQKVPGVPQVAAWAIQSKAMHQHLDAHKKVPAQPNGCGLQNRL